MPPNIQTNIEYRGSADMQWVRKQAWAGEGSMELWYRKKQGRGYVLGSQLPWRGKSNFKSDF